jgi:type I restriction enzyme, S subunit
VSGAGLPDLPRNWTTPPVYARFSVQLGKMLDEKRITRSHLAPYLRNVDVQWNHINTVDLPEMDFSDKDRQQYSLRSGDLLVCEGGEVGRTAIWGGALNECYFQKAVHRLRPITDDDEPRFFRYFMQMAVESGVFAGTTASTIQHLPAEKLRVVRYPAPPIEEQRRIADYLDRETARLDALIAAKGRVLALLAEKRRALITRAVTRGLDDKTLVKDTGVEWLTQVPRHWTSTKISRLFRQAKRLGFPDLTVLSVYRDYGVIERASRDDNVNRVPDDLEKYQLVEVGDLVINKMKAWQGSLGIARLRGITSPDYVVFRPFHREDPSFLHFLLRNHRLTTVYLSMSNGIRTSQWRLEPDRFGDLVVFLPPLFEQRTIVHQIAAETAKGDDMRVATERTIKLLKERRAAIISAAVTGKIDVERGEYYTDDAARPEEPGRRQ